MIHHIRLRYNIVYNIRIHFVYKPVIRNLPTESLFGKLNKDVNKLILWR